MKKYWFAANSIVLML